MRVVERLKCPRARRGSVWVLLIVAGAITGSMTVIGWSTERGSNVLQRSRVPGGSRSVLNREVEAARREGVRGEIGVASRATHAGSGGAQRGGAVVEAVAAQVSRSDQADLTFEIRPLENGVQVVGRRGRLEITKSVHPGGEFELELAVARGDKVTFAVNSESTRVSRGKTNVTLPHGTPDEAAEMKIRRLLADSPAVAQFRAAAAALVDTEDSSPPALAFVVSDAAVGALTGDVGAPGRVAKHLGRNARGRVRPAGMAADCYTVMETRMMFASNDYQQCWISTIYNSFYQGMCSWRWLLQVESYWFSFISCSGIKWS
ncbi:MAG: hypothetical protein AB7J63_18680 [Vicinamibacterales bacterium]